MDFGPWSQEQGLQLAPSICPRLHGDKGGKPNTHRLGVGACAGQEQAAAGMGAAGCPAAPGSPYSWGTCGVLTARQHHATRGGEERSSRCPVPSTEPPCPRAKQFSRAGIHTALQHGDTQPPSHQTSTPPSLVTATTQAPAFTIFFLQMSKGQAFTGLLRKSQPRPALAHQRPKSWNQRLQQPTRISSLSLAPGLTAPEVGLSSLGGLGETEQLCTCPQLMSDLFRRKSGLSGMKEPELAA